MIYQALYDLAYTALFIGLFWPFFFLSSRGFFHSSRRRLQGLAALYTTLFFAILAASISYKDARLQLIVSTLTIGVVGLVTDWLVFRRRKNH